MKTNLNLLKSYLAALLVFSAGLYLLAIFVFGALRGRLAYYIVGQSDFNISISTFKILTPGWLHFLLNALLLLWLSYFGLLKSRPWSRIVIASGCGWVFLFDLIGTQMYTKLLPTPIIPGAFVSLAIYFTTHLGSMSYFNYNSAAPIKKSTLAIYGFLLFVIGFLGIIKVVLNGSSPDINETNKIILALTHIGWTNVSGTGIVIMILSHLSNYINDPSIARLCTTYTYGSALILLFSSTLSLNYFLIFSAPLFFSLISILLKIVYSYKI